MRSEYENSSVKKRNEYISYTEDLYCIVVMKKTRIIEERILMNIHNKLVRILYCIHI